MTFNRRDFLKNAARASALLSIGAVAPQFLSRAAAAQSGAATGDTVLVVIQLTGGNDGLNTIVPYGNDDYRRNRPKLAIPERGVLRINDELGFHPAMTGLRDLYDRGLLGIVQGVGYLQPNRSHFEAMDIWHTCQTKSQRRESGWLGRYLDESVKGDGGDVPALHLGHEGLPLALAAKRVRVPSINSLDRFRLQTKESSLRNSIGQLVSASRPKDNDLLGFVESSASSALAASQRVDLAKGDYTSAIEYPDTALSDKLRTIAQLIDAGLSTRVFYVTLDGFDTHAQQADAHTALLSQLSGAVQAFIDDVAGHGHDERVLVACFSEFGRRVAENASAGTDHGAAAPMLLAGRKVRSGLIGEHPSLTDLDDGGDLKFDVDFRTVYAALLENWLGWPAAPVLGDDWKPADVLAG